MSYLAGKYDIIVIGAGHAGIEAALAAARLGCTAAIFTINMDAVGNMPCNPSIGGTAKGHLVREIDALGGEMGKAADKCTIQSRMLNRGKGPAVHSLRAQIDRRAYAVEMKHRLELQENLDLIQGEIVSLEKNPAFGGNNNAACGIKDNTDNPISFDQPDGDYRWICTTRLNASYLAKAVIVATGTYLAGKIFVGEVDYEGGPDGMFPAKGLSDSLRKLGIELRRFKTGTPARVSRKSLDLDKLEVQYGDEPVTPFSFETEEKIENRTVCHISYTNQQTKDVILANLHRSPLYGGKIEGVGPRYCPSIEDKIVRFADKERHQLFIEPCGINTEEMYLQGMSSSLPEEVQVRFLRTIEGLERVRIMRTAYAIEYDCVNPIELKSTLEFKAVEGLYGSGQFNGSSGYEEAAAQGLVAGINAARKIQGKPPVVIDRSQGYIGTLIDDLVTKGCADPYRMMTSRSEYRLVLRQDNADERLTPLGHEIGLISDERWKKFTRKQQQKQKEIERLSGTVVAPTDRANEIMRKYGTAELTTGVKMVDLIKRPQLGYEVLAPLDEERPQLDAQIVESVEIEIKYEGYVKRQNAQINEMRRLENRLLPEDVDYTTIKGLRLEAQEKLNRIRPRSIGQAGRISGVSPSDISVLLIWLGQKQQ
ncbi:MAG: tRNA uridine-5-carboxymethylaminomethyl(34) synthesis enzyme MnmG [Clostridia bacterium]|nr:tRNA uridine-5-carboxymethylaminomethyl(34) synthesis enzyme MnmG [Clostridia bacterium]